jgi:hypothetical protein
MSIQDTPQPTSPLPFTAKLPRLLRGSFYRFRKCTSTLYAVGKVTAHGWRDAFDVLMPNSSWEEYLSAEPVPTHFGFNYGGPFFVACDHCCSHGNSSHATDSLCVYDRPDDAPRLGRVFRRSERQIQQAGFAFVWAGLGEEALDTAYGSLVEIGIAHALHKPILFAHHPLADLRDFWFAIESASAVVSAERPISALEMLGSDLDRAAGRSR